MQVNLPHTTRLLAVLLLSCGAVLVDSALAGGSRRARRHPRPPPELNFPRPSGYEFGDPLPGLTDEQLDAFKDGREDFEEEDTPETGLGPTFNNVSCVACHSAPATGGSSDLLVTRFGHRRRNGQFDPMADKGGSLLQEFAIDPSMQEVVPDGANVVAHRQTTPLFGLGLIEAIPDSVIQVYADSDKPDGVKGHACQVTDVASGESRIGHFGWKAQQATLLAFSGDAYLNEVGITSRLFPTENAPNGKTELLAPYIKGDGPEDQVDPATGKSDIDHFAEYMRMLAPPPGLHWTDDARAGGRVFLDLGCAVCHVPVMYTGSSDIEALDHKPVVLFSDLLLHDMGSLNDGIGQGDAGPNEMKTPPLWGLRASGPYLHDGRADSVDAAIRAHEGEGTVSRDRYVGLTDHQRSQLLEFLNSN